MIAGSCLCGKVKYQIEGKIYLMNHCHCSRCRKSHGAVFGSFLHASLKGFKWISGQIQIKTYQPSNQDARCFCLECGSNVPVIDGDDVIIPAGTLDTDPIIKPIVHIFTQSKAPWFEITDSLPQFEEYAPDEWINNALQNKIITDN